MKNPITQNPKTPKPQNPVRYPPNFTDRWKVSEKAGRLNSASIKVKILFLSKISHAVLLMVATDVELFVSRLDDDFIHIFTKDPEKKIIILWSKPKEL